MKNSSDDYTFKIYFRYEMFRRNRHLENRTKYISEIKKIVRCVWENNKKIKSKKS